MRKVEFIFATVKELCNVD